MTNTTQLKIALAGNPNAGKTSIFNALTGAHQHVGNYPGVTVEKREGRYRRGDTIVEVTDLPGTYSLTSYSPEERIAQDELLWKTPDVVVVVADATNLSRSLVILTQIMHLRRRLILCLNFADEARDAGQELDLPLLEQLLGIPVIETIAHKGKGVERLKELIAEILSKPLPERRLVLGKTLRDALDEIEPLLTDTDLDDEIAEWVAVKLLVGDEMFVARARARGESGRWAVDAASNLRDRLEHTTGQDIALFVTERYYGFVDGLLREVVTKRPREDARVFSDRIDSVLAHRVLGLPFFLLAMYVLFWLTFTVGEYPMAWIEAVFGFAATLVSGFWPAGSDSLLRSLLVDGIIGGVGGVVVFLPNIVLLFLGLAFMEDTGYMARAAHLTDALMHRFGLHGRSFIPMLTGFGCSVPGIMATRTLENERDRLITMLVLPLMSCGARLPIWMLLIPAFFPAPWRAPILWLIYMTGIGVALTLALSLRRTVLKGEEAPFVMELPPYRLPTIRAIAQKMGQRSWLYLRKAGTVILAISILMWAATVVPRLETQEIDNAVEAGRVRVVASDEERAELARSVGPGVELLTAGQIEGRRRAEQLQSSIAGQIGRSMEPALRPLGLDWRVGTAMLGAFAAKEVFVAQLGIVYSMGETDEESADLQSAIRRDYSPLAGVALILFLLIATPCMATVAVTRRESGSWKWAVFQFVGLTLLGYLLALIVFQVGSLVS